MATLQMAMYTARRNQERKVRSLARWSRASEDSLLKTRGAKNGRARNGCGVVELRLDVGVSFVLEA
ncbi:hypothetical protein FH972_022490 [Carpinus fangiana]|uniref:Uncharacterized protein n=1 Tax=Carpinus fangiana TaxID=176857 RepID=A0A5N6KUN7_9ROSI|nr:hypothetical protein FH972_022490 [Carpinus fangiana]